MCPQRDDDPLGLHPVIPYRKRADSSKLAAAKAHLAALHRQMAYLEETRRQCREGLIGVEAAIAGKRATIAAAEAEIRFRREQGEEA